MKFRYKAKKGPDEIVEGAIEAPNQDMAVAKIIEQGFVPVSVERETGKPSAKAPVAAAKPPQVLSGRKVSKNDIYLFTRKLKVLLKSQVPILNSLHILEDQIANKDFKDMLKKLIESVKEGVGFSEALANFPQHFPPLYISIIKAGEASGKLDYSLDQIAKYLNAERQLSQKVKSSLAYPAVMITVGIATIAFILTFVVPKLKVLFEDFVETLPVVTKILLGISVFFSKYWILMFVILILFIAFLFYTKTAPWQKKALYKIKKKTPVVRKIIYNQSLARLARGLAILLSSGVSVLDSIKIATPLVDDNVAQGQLEDVYKDIVSGGGLEESLRNRCAFLPDMFIKMVAIGEASGRLDEILSELGDSYADEVELLTKVVTSLIEPLAILVVGGILSFIVIAVLLPIFEISFLIQ